MWGQESYGNVWYVSTKIIPTRVGTREILCSGIEVIRDHPHACGDKLIAELVFICTIGSSPRVWGQDFKNPSQTATRRIIPTRVGTSLPAIANDFKTAYHPHVCGDKSSVPRSTVPNTGSSPRMWGQVDTIFSGLANCRIIPTRVGTSLQRNL